MASSLRVGDHLLERLGATAQTPAAASPGGAWGAAVLAVVPRAWSLVVAGRGERGAIQPPAVAAR